eukprot:5217881-Pleurochrysis_carterae.AAC.1
MRRTLPVTTSSSSPTKWRTTFLTPAWRRRSTGSPPQPRSCSLATRASLAGTSWLSWQSTS